MVLIFDFLFFFFFLMVVLQGDTFPPLRTTITPPVGQINHRPPVNDVDLPGRADTYLMCDLAYVAVMQAV